MKILPDYSMYVNGYGDGGYGYGGGFGDGYWDGNGRRRYYMHGDGDITFKVIHKKYPHNLIIIMNWSHANYI